MPTSALICGEIFLLTLLVALSAFFSGSETALFSLSRARLLSYSTSRTPSEICISRLMDRYDRTLICLVFCNMFVNVGVSVVGNELAGNAGLGKSGTLLLSALSAVLLLLVFGEVTPKAVALAHAGRISHGAAPVIWKVRGVLWPVICISEKFFRAVLDVLGRKKSMPLSSEEYSSYLEMAYSVGAFSDEEAELLENIFDLRKDKVRKIMTPRIKIIPVKKRMDGRAVARLIQRECQAFYPVVRNDPDDADCFLSAKDFYALPVELRNSWPEAGCTFPAVFIPENASLTAALSTMKNQRVPIAFVSDEYGGVVGTIELKDIYGELVGEIEREHEEPDWRIILEKPGTWIVDGRIPLDELEELTGLTLPNCGADTLNGLFCQFLDRIPDRDAELHIGNVRMKALQVSDNSVLQARISGRGK